jgi:RNA polymerase sigma-70 factor (ECF subfamily)
LARVENTDIDLSDEDLLTRLRNGERDLFGQLVRRYQRELYAYLVRYTGDAQLAEDVFQNTFLQVHLKVQQYEPGRPVRPWLYRIATNQAIDLLRSVNRHQAVSLEQTQSPTGDSVVSLLELIPETEDGPFEAIQLEEMRNLVRLAIRQLPEMLRGVVLLAYFQELKYSEIADILEIPVGTVKSRLHNALNRLHQIWVESQTPEEGSKVLPVERPAKPLVANPR